MAELKRRLSISIRDEVLTFKRGLEDTSKLVYVIHAKSRRKIQYAEGRSRIAYIGMTEAGVWRIAPSVAERYSRLLTTPGVTEATVTILTAQPRQGLRKRAHKLERAMLLGFRDLFGEIPMCNTQGKGIHEMDEFDYFSRSRIENIIRGLS